MQATYEGYTHSAQFNKALKLTPKFKFTFSKTCQEHNFLIPRSKRKLSLLNDTSHYWNTIHSKPVVHEYVEIYLYKEITKNLTSKIFF